MKNLCHFDVRLGGVHIPAAKEPLKFSPRLGGEDPVKTLLGYDPPSGVGVDDIDTDRRVLIPRFAAAIAWALASGLEPLTVPQKHLGERGRPGAPELVLNGGVEELEPAPVGLAYEFAKTPLSGVFQFRDVQRMVGGGFPIVARGIGTFEPLVSEEGARDLPDGSAVLPPLRDGSTAVIVPNSGPCVRAAQALGVAVLVTGVPHPVTKEVELYRVA
jgi:hypothetical protein